MTDEERDNSGEPTLTTNRRYIEEREEDIILFGM